MQNNIIIINGPNINLLGDRDKSIYGSESYESLIDRCKSEASKIEKTDEDTTFLGSIIDGFQKYGNAYPSASYADGDKKVIYLDGRRKSLFDLDDTDVLCDLAVGMTEFICGGSRINRDIADEVISFAEAGGHTELLERLLDQPKAYFDSFKRIDFSEEAA